MRSSTPMRGLQALRAGIGTRSGARTPEATPFQSPRWLLPWWRQFGTGMPRVADRASEGGRAGSVLPLYVLPERGAKAAADRGGDRPTISTRSATRRRCFPPRSRASGRRESTLCDLIEVPPGSALRGSGRRRAGGRRGRRAVRAPCCSFPAIPSGHPPQAADEPPPSRARRRLDGEMAGPGRCSLPGRAGAAAQARWTAQGETGVLASADGAGVPPRSRAGAAGGRRCCGCRCCASPARWRP